jgi:YVTN family beta-propeller protein
MGAAVLAGGTGLAHADAASDATQTKAASARGAGPAHAESPESSSGKRYSVGTTRSVAHAAVAANNAKPVVLTPASAAAVRRSLSHAAVGAISQKTAIDPVAAASAPPVRQTPVQALAGVVVNALVALGGMDPVTPEPARGNLWQLGLYSVARWLADTANPGGVPKEQTISIGPPDPETGVVTGRVLFTNATGDPLTYRVTVDPTEGTATINPDGSYTFTPLQAARLGAPEGGTTVTMVATAYHGVQQSSHVVNVQLIKAAFAVPVIIHVGDTPGLLALSPDGTRLVVANRGSDSISVIDTATNTKVTPDITVGDSPSTADFTPDGSAVYVVNFGTGTQGYSLSRVSLLNNSVVTIPISGAGLAAMGPANTPAAGRLYLTNFAMNTVSIVDTATNTVLPGSIPVGQSPLDLAVSPSGQRVYVANATGHSLSVISTASNIVTATVPLAIAPGAAGPGGLAVTPNGKFVYATVLDANPVLPGAVWVIDTATNTVSAPPIPVGVQPQAIAVSPDGSVVYVANAVSNTVSAISTATNTVIKTFTVGVGPIGLAVSSARLYVSNSQDDTVTVITL